MKALVYHGPGKKAVEDRPKPEISGPTDAIVRLVKTTICGTDLHILKGDVPTCTPGRILGHEGVGVVDKVGNAVTPAASSPTSAFTASKPICTWSAYGTAISRSQQGSSTR
jgi:threonine dehydrogenase-like Zn-dependent dehydrogenase